jgi:hypothetical protein
MAMFSLMWGCTFLAAGVLAWRRSRFAAFAFLAAMGLLLTLGSYVFPTGQLLVRSASLVTVLVGLMGAWYLSRVRPFDAGRRVETRRGRHDGRSTSG